MRDFRQVVNARLMVVACICLAVDTATCVFKKNSDLEYFPAQRLRKRSKHSDLEHLAERSGLGYSQAQRPTVEAAATYYGQGP